MRTECAEYPVGPAKLRTAGLTAVRAMVDAFHDGAEA